MSAAGCLWPIASRALLRGTRVLAVVERGTNIGFSGSGRDFAHELKDGAVKTGFGIGVGLTVVAGVMVSGCARTEVGRVAVDLMIMSLAWKRTWC